jgi:hypothetical protein
MVFMAHYMSETKIVLKLPGEGVQQEESFVRSMEPRFTLLLPFDMHMQVSPIDALVNLARHVGFTIDRSALSKLGVSNAPTTVRFQGTPLYQAIHELLNDPGRGFALDNRSLIVYPQTLNTGNNDNKGLMIDWNANLRLSRQPLLVVPSGRSNVWFSIFLTGDTPQSIEAMNTVQVEVWRGAELLTMAKADLDQHGNAQLSLSTIERIAVSIKRMEPPGRSQAGLYTLGFYYQSFGSPSGA